MTFDYKHSLCIILFIILSPMWAFAQIDSTYIRPFEQDFAARIYVNDKFAGFNKENEKDSKQEFIYKTNQPVSIGLGASWKNFSFGFSYGADIMRAKEQGKTKSLEFQYHGYARMFTYDCFLQQHKGFYDENKNKDGTYRLLSDVKLTMYGGSLQYIFNNKRFSYRAAFNQNERQIKSSGSLLAGVALYYSKINSDSTQLFEGMSKHHETLQFGLTAGYAYSWAISPRWLATLSFTTGITIGNNHPNHFFKERMEVYPILNGRFAIGYNADSWSIGSHFMMNKVYLFHAKNESLSMENGQLQVTFIKRFNWGNKFVNETLNKTKKKLRL